MIESIKCIKNVGPFKSIGPVELGKTTLIYAENGRGKTMLSEVFRSLTNNDPGLVADRERLAADGAEPEITLTLTGGKDLKWTPDGWQGERPKVAVFNDGFVGANVYSGLEVTSEHRKGLHSLIIGEEGVKLADDFKTAQTRATNAGNEAKKVAGKINEAVPGVPDIDKYCEERIPDDIDKQIKDNAVSIEDAKNVTTIRRRPTLSKLELPFSRLDALRALLSKDLKQVADDAMKRVKAHLEGLEKCWVGGEAWVSDGWKHAGDHKDCPYCGQPISNSSLVKHYATYFEGAYGNLKAEIAVFRAEFENDNSETRRRRLEQQAREMTQLRAEWTNPRLDLGLEMPFNSSQIAECWQLFDEEAKRALARKESSPLELIQLDAEVLRRMSDCISAIESENERLPTINAKILAFKEQVEAMDVQELEGERAHLERLKMRETREVEQLCVKYRKQVENRQRLENHRDRLNDELKAYRERVFEEYAESVNRYLEGFGTGFTLPNIKPTSRSGGTTEYEFEINGQLIEIASERPTAGGAWFNNTLSGGDRTALALAFFFASLERREDLDQTTIVIDDPLSSLDYGRRDKTIDYTSYLAGETQLIVLSHDRDFLCKLSNDLPTSDSWRCKRLIAKQENDEEASEVDDWDLDQARLSVSEVRALRMTRYLETGHGHPDSIAEDIRSALESFVYLVFPDKVERPNVVGKFIGRCDSLMGKRGQLLGPDALRELRSLNKYSRKYHHTEEKDPPNEVELRRYVKSTLRFFRSDLTK